jgi:hypothetical protein
MTYVPDLLEQITNAINRGGFQQPGQGYLICYEFLSNIGALMNLHPVKDAAPRSNEPFSADVLPLIQQMTWALNNNSSVKEVQNFLKTIAFYLDATFVQGTGPFVQPSTPPLPPALEFMPLDNINTLYQVTYWLINQGRIGNPKAWAFLQAIAFYLFRNIKTEGTGPFRYPA